MKKGVVIVFIFLTLLFPTYVRAQTHEQAGQVAQGFSIGNIFASILRFVFGTPILLPGLTTECADAIAVLQDVVPPEEGLFRPTANQKGKPPCQGIVTDTVNFDATLQSSRATSLFSGILTWDTQPEVRATGQIPNLTISQGFISGDGEGDDVVNTVQGWAFGQRVLSSTNERYGTYSPRDQINGFNGALAKLMPYKTKSPANGEVTTSLIAATDATLADILIGYSCPILGKHCSDERWQPDYWVAYTDGSQVYGIRTAGGNVRPLMASEFACVRKLTVTNKITQNDTDTICKALYGNNYSRGQTSATSIIAQRVFSKISATAYTIERPAPTTLYQPGRAYTYIPYLGSYKDERVDGKFSVTAGPNDPPQDPHTFEGALPSVNAVRRIGEKLSALFLPVTRKKALKPIAESECGDECRVQGDHPDQIADFFHPPTSLWQVGEEIDRPRPSPIASVAPGQFSVTADRQAVISMSFTDVLRTIYTDTTSNQSWTRALMPPAAGKAWSTPFKGTPPELFPVGFDLTCSGDLHCNEKADVPVLGAVTRLLDPRCGYIIQLVTHPASFENKCLETTANAGRWLSNLMQEETERKTLADPWLQVASLNEFNERSSTTLSLK